MGRDDEGGLRRTASISTSPTRGPGNCGARNSRRAGSLRAAVRASRPKAAVDPTAYTRALTAWLNASAGMLTAWLNASAGMLTAVWLSTARISAANGCQESSSNGSSSQAMLPDLNLFDLALLWLLTIIARMGELFARPPSLSQSNPTKKTIRIVLLKTLRRVRSLQRIRKRNSQRGFVSLLTCAQKADPFLLKIDFIL